MRARLTALANIAAAYPAAVVATVVVGVLAPQPMGFLALAQIALPYLFALAIPLVPLAFVTRARPLVVALLIAGLLALSQFGDEWISWPFTGAGPSSLTLASWNMQYNAVSREDAVRILSAQDVDLVAMQELTDRTAAAIAADPLLTARYPYRVLEPDESVLGIGLLSRYPIAAHEFLTDPVGVMARIDLGEGRQVTVLNAHPLPGRIGVLSFDGTDRDVALRRLRARIDQLINEGVPLLVIGDLNVASSEPSYRWLSAGLRDVHREVGMGPGWTWRPGRLQGLGIGLLRIDYVLTGQTMLARTISQDCSVPGDHCLVRAAVDVP